MAKDLSKFLESHLNKILTKSFRPSSDFNKEYYHKIPQIFYKFRECNEHNFDALENEYLWLVTAEEFKEDLFDSTIYYDISTQRNRIKKVIKDRLPEIVVEVFKRDLAKKGISANITKEDIEFIKENKERFINNKGRPRLNEIKKHLIQNGLSPHKTNELINTIKKTISKESIEAKSKIFLKKLNSLNEVTRKSHYISCLTLEKDNDVMWNRYADNKKGFCIAYDIKKLEKIGFDKYRFLYNLQPVIYKKRKQFDISKLYNLAFSKYMRDKKISQEKNVIIEMNMQVRTKKPEYSYEKEWRFIIEKTHVRDRKHYFPFASAIYAGCEIIEQDLINLKTIAHKLQIPIYLQKFNDSRSEYIYIKLD